MLDFDCEQLLLEPFERAWEVWRPASLLYHMLRSPNQLCSPTPLAPHVRLSRSIYLRPGTDPRLPLRSALRKRWSGNAKRRPLPAACASF